MSIADRIKALRTQLNIPQIELASRVGVDVNTVWRWESGKSSPLRSVEPLAQALGTSVAYLMGETNDPKRHTAMPGINENLTKIRRRFALEGKMISREPSLLSLAKSEDNDTPPREATVNMDEAIYPSEWTKVPVYDIRTCAGYGTAHLFEDIEMLYELPLPVMWVGSISQDADKKPFLTKIDGDSMSAAGLSNGMLAVVNPNEEVFSGQSALVCYGKNRETAIKRVYFLPDGSVELHSATPGFPVRVYTKEQLRSEDAPLIIIGRVMGAWTGEPTRG